VGHEFELILEKVDGEGKGGNEDDECEGRFGFGFEFGFGFVVEEQIVVAIESLECEFISNAFI